MNEADLQGLLLSALRDKYERMLVLRTLHERARRDATFIEPDPRPAMAKLADDYPGSLREIDVLPLETIAERIAALALAEHDPSTAEPWMIAQSLFHRFARAALVTKRWLGGRKAISPALRSSFATAAPALGHDVALFAEDLDAIASPPRGRLMDVVHAKVALALKVSTTEARALVFEAHGPSAAERDQRTKR